MNILVKMPSRSRPEKLISNIQEYYEKATNKTSIGFLVSIDEDDETQQVVLDWYGKNKIGVLLKIGKSESKIHACNRDIEQVTEFGLDWDIVVLASDDMRVQVHGWDEIIRQNMAKHFQDTDGCLWFNDGAKHSAGAKQVICTLSIIGRKYYDQYGYIYYPGYKSFFCDNEFTEVAAAQKKITYIDQVIIRHEHPHWGYGKQDDLYKENQKYWKHDQELYHSRKQSAFK